MGAFETLFGKIKMKVAMGNYFQMLNAYTPIYTTYDGGVYEMELTRACVHTFATHCSKLSPVVIGPDSARIGNIFKTRPNPFHTWAQFAYKAATIYEASNTCCIVPILDTFDRITGFYPVNPAMTEVRELDGEPYLVYTFGNGQKMSVELSRVGVTNKFLYNSDLFGEDNSALNPTMQLLDVQNQGIREGIKNSAAFRFMARVSNFATAEGLKKEREKFTNSHLGSDSGGVLLFPNTYDNIQQVQATAKIVDPEQMKLIEGRVYTYFGCNDKILHNQASGDDWAAYYEGKIEPFAIQLSQAMTSMVYSANQRTRGNEIIWTANRMQYMTTQHKLQVSTQLFDRGILCTDDVMDIWQLPHVPDGDKRYIRKEYTEVSKLGTDTPPAGDGQTKEGEGIDPEK